MKKIFLCLLTIVCFTMSSCDKPLDEVPLDFYTPENSFNNKTQFESALANIYLRIRTNFYSYPLDNFGLDLDLVNYEDNKSITKQRYFGWDNMNADNAFSNTWWTNLYAIIGQTNVIIDRADKPQAVWTTPEEKNAIVGEAKFLRAWAYHFLANQWGDVPLILNETLVARFDLVRAPQKEVLLQCKADLDFAIKNMPSINQIKGGRAPREAAYHTLSEINISLKDYDGAITAANGVINGGKHNLMNQRFGTRKDFMFSGYTYSGPAKPWGDVYWDLFQEGGMNWQEGNMEAIWNISEDPTIKGGNNSTDSPGAGLSFDRYWGPIHWQSKDKDNVQNWLMDTLYGRPIAWYIVSQYADKTIWEYKNDFLNDIRNSESNIQRDWYFTNPNSKYFGQLMTKNNVDPSTLNLWEARLSPHYKKFVSAVPQGLAIDAASKRKNDGGRNWKDWYIMRLAETYLLRAEANMLKGDLAAAANDINIIRSRANATLVTAADVNMDLILDERARELYGEEFRLNTLMRTGKLVEYLNKYNGYLKDNNLKAPDYVKLLPIPRREIEANTGAVLTQNPGY